MGRINTLPEAMEGAERVALVVVLSAFFDSFCDAVRLVRLFKSLKPEIGYALEKLTSNISYMPSLEGVKVVPAEYVRHFADAGGKAELIIVDGLYACVVKSELSVESFVYALKRISQNVVVRTFMPISNNNSST